MTRSKDINEKYEKKGISSGAIAAIVIAVLIIVLIIGYITWSGRQRKRNEMMALMNAAGPGMRGNLR